MDQDHHPLAKKWRDEASAYERDGQPGAALLRRVAKELEDHEESNASFPLTLDQAAAESGYSKDHLSLLISQGKLPNAGKKGAPRVHRRDLPKKPRSAPLSRASASGPQMVQAALAEQGIPPNEV